MIFIFHQKLFRGANNILLQCYVIRFVGNNGKFAYIFLLNYIYQTLNFLELPNLMPKANVIEHTGFPISSGMALMYLHSDEQINMKLKNR